jgi:hypothetical protein
MVLQIPETTRDLAVLVFNRQEQLISRVESNRLEAGWRAVHRFENLHSAPAKALAIIPPGLLGPGYFREIAAVLQSTLPGTPPDSAVIGEIMRRHGLTVAS